MEFKYRADDERPASLENPSAPSSSSHITSYLSQHTMRACLSSSDLQPISNIMRNMDHNNNVYEALQLHFEKEQIMEEIIIAEIARRRMLEAEVMRELMMGRACGPTQGLSFKPRLPLTACPLNEPLAIAGCSSLFNVLPLNLISEPVVHEVRPSSDVNKDKLIVLAISGEKRKAESPPVVGDSSSTSSQLLPSSLRKKPKEEWSCALCQVSTTSQSSLNEHLQGRKHKAKEASLRAPKCGNNFWSIEPLPEKTGQGPSEVMGIPCQDKEQDVENPEKGDKEAIIMVVEKEEGLRESNNKKMKLWCEMCKTTADSQVVMDAHKKGKKHMARLRKLLNKHEGTMSKFSNLTASSDCRNKEAKDADVNGIEEENHEDMWVEVDDKPTGSVDR